jgi:hypothetical protein
VPEFSLTFNSPLPAHRVVEKAWQRAVFEGWKVLEHRHGAAVVMREPPSPLSQDMVVRVSAEQGGSEALVQVQLSVEIGNPRTPVYLQRKGEQLREILIR